MGVIKTELREVREKYGDDRLTEIVDELPEITIEDMIKEEDVVVTITYGGYIKRTPLDQYKQQLRGGKGKIGISVREDDFVNQLYIASTHSYIILFTTAGRAHIRKVHTIPESQLSSKGRPVINLIKAEKGEKITAVTHVKDFTEDKFLFLATRKGQVKKMSLSLVEEREVHGHKGDRAARRRQPHGRASPRPRQRTSCSPRKRAWPSGSGKKISGPWAGQLTA